MRTSFLCLLMLLAGSPLAWAATPRQQTINDCDGNDPDRAIPACKALIESGTETNHGLIATHYYLATAYFRKGLYDQSIREYDMAIDLDTDSYMLYEILQGRSISYYATCKLDAALADTKRDIALKPDNARNYFNRGLIYLRNGDIARARVDFERAHRMNPADFPTPDKAFALSNPAACVSAEPKAN